MTTVSANEKFGALARLSDMMGCLHEEQTTQLKFCGIACSESVKSCEVVPDFDSKNLLYILEVESPKIEKDFAQRVAVLKKMVTVLLRGWSCSVRLREYGTFSEGE